MKILTRNLTYCLQILHFRDTMISTVCMTIVGQLGFRTFWVDLVQLINLITECLLIDNESCRRAVCDEFVSEIF